MLHQLLCLNGCCLQHLEKFQMECSQIILFLHFILNLLNFSKHFDLKIFKLQDTPIYYNPLCIFKKQSHDEFCFGFVPGEICADSSLPDSDG